MRRYQEKKPWYITVLAMLILSGVALAKQEEAKKLALFPIAGAFLMGFGVMIFQAVKEWKESDKQVLEKYGELARFFSGSKTISLEDRKKHFLGAMSVWGIAFLGGNNRPPLGTALVFLGLILLIFGIPLLITWKGSPKTTENKVSPEAVAALLVGLVTSGFFCAFIGIGVYHGAWWFVLPPGLCFLSWSSRPLVAGLRTLLGGTQDSRDRGEAHLRREQEMDPWDRPDKKY